MSSYREIMEGLVGKTVKVFLGGPGGHGNKVGKLMVLEKDFCILLCANGEEIIYDLKHIIGIQPVSTKEKVFKICVKKDDDPCE